MEDEAKEELHFDNNFVLQKQVSLSGVIDVELHEDSEGYITLVGYPSMAGSRKASKLTSTSPVSSGSETDSPDINGRVPQSTSSTDTSYWYAQKLLVPY